MATYILVKLLVVALFALGASVHANDGNPCRHIEIFDPYVGGNVIFDLSSLIAQGPIVVNQTWNGIDWQEWTFGVCTALSTPCPNTEVGSVSVCGAPNKAAMCQKYTDPRNGAGSFCVSSWNGTITTNLDGDGERGLHVRMQPGDQHEEFRTPANMMINIECDHSIDRVDPNAVYVMPPYHDSTLFLVHFRHKAGCPTNVNVHTPSAPTSAPTDAPTAAKKSGMPGSIVGLISIAMLLIGLFGGAFGGLWLNSKYGWFSDPHRQAAAYTQFELDEDI